MMTSEFPTCPQCVRKIMQSVSNRCMYCGADLPEVHHLSSEEKNRLLTGKLEQMRQNEENADELVSAMRRNFGMPDRKPRMATKRINAPTVLRRSMMPWPTSRTILSS